jgi:hypothetical protein
LPSSDTPFISFCTNRRGTLRTTWLAQCTLPYMEVTLLKSITWLQQQQQQRQRWQADDE